jgi:hypothetical protein
VNGAQALAIEMHDAMLANGFSSNTPDAATADWAFDFRFQFGKSRLHLSRSRPRVWVLEILRRVER